MLSRGKLLAVWGLTTSVTFAGTMGPTCNEKVTLPCPRNAFSLGAQALYLKPSYAGASTIGATVDTLGNQRFQTLEPWEWGFEIDGSYLFGTGNDISMNWYHWNDSITRNYYTYFFNSLQDALVSPSVYFKPSWDAVNVEFGQEANFGPYWTARFFGGAQWTKIQKDFNFTGTNSGFVDWATNSSLSSTYNAGGPRVGADFSYERWWGISVYSKTAAAILVGKSKFSGSTTIPVSVSPVLSFATIGSNVTIVAPEIEEKLGAQYTWNIPQGALTFDLGWMWVNYFNPLEQPSASAVNYTGNSTRGNNFGFQGLYFGVKIVGNSFV